MLLYSYGWQQQASFANSNYVPATKISVIIPARNEEQNIGDCIRSILSQNYPAELFEIIVVDDHSEDNTAATVNSFQEPNVYCIDLAAYVNETEALNSYKKKALSTGIMASEGDVVVTTDADCLAKPGWLSLIAALYQRTGAVMIVAPVNLSSDRSVLQVFQSIDFMSMQGITAAAQRLGMGNMANGANLAFSRAAYESVDGYAGIDHMASGDDYLLMVKLQNAYPGRIAYLKSTDAIVSTTPQHTWRGFLRQRIRWASKSGKYDDHKLTVILGLVYLFNCSFLILFIAGFFNSLFFGLAGLMLVCKIMSELIFLIPVSRFFNKQKQLLYFSLLQPLHIAYIIIAGFLGFIGGYEWKGRRVK
ncbi:MAG: hypothetical protein BGO69_17910 [Bacteroidetes bacterium 46-16]|nr:MAG: hypothetical protein BGO69_17910 [Bacteroidetes bacterium 46-16]